MSELYQNRYSQSSILLPSIVTNQVRINIFYLDSFGIIGLGKESRKIFEFKGLIGKIFQNKDLAEKMLHFRPDSGG